MKTKIFFTKKDCLAALVCGVFALMCMGAIGGVSHKHAKDMVCRANLQKWSVAMREFTDDNDGTFWMGWNPTAYDVSDVWISALRDYHGDNYTIRCCPTAKQPEWNLDGTEGPGYDKQPFRAWGIFDGSFFSRGDYGSYGVNGWLNGPEDFYTVDPSNWWRNITNITAPETVPFLLDAQWVDAWPEPTDPPPHFEDSNWFTDPGHFVRIVQNRHEMAQNCAFVDGTVRRVGLKELWTLKWHRNFDTAGPWTLAGGVNPSYWPEWMQGMEDY
jgi:hypothetical protein